MFVSASNKFSVIFVLLSVVLFAGLLEDVHARRRSSQDMIILNGHQTFIRTGEGNHREMIIFGRKRRSIEPEAMVDKSETFTGTNAGTLVDLAKLNVERVVYYPK